MTGDQIRAGRALIRWTIEVLADRSKVSATTIKRAENTDGPLRMTAANASAIRAALEAGGVEFIDPNGGGPGVRLRRQA